MERSYFIEHAGKKIFILDFTDCQPAEMLPIIEECGRQVQKQPSKSVYTITIARGGRFDFNCVEKLKQLTKDNEPYVIKSAVVGMSGLQQLLLMIVSSFSNRKFELFDELQQAKKFIAADS
jgi:hypothetical protein